MELSVLPEVLSVVFGALSLYAGGKYIKIKNFIKELAEAVVVTNKSIEDDKITKEEMESIIKEWQDVIQVFKK